MTTLVSNLLTLLEDYLSSLLGSYGMAVGRLKRCGFGIDMNVYREQSQLQNPTSPNPAARSVGCLGFRSVFADRSLPNAFDRNTVSQDTVTSRQSAGAAQNETS